jgi:hypothetical protein
MVQSDRQLPGNGPVVLEQLVSHALGRLDANPRQTFEGLDQGGKGVGVGHGAGIWA